MSRILIVDDDVGVRRSLARYLGVYDHEIEAAEDGNAALECLASGFDPDIILSDVDMDPGMGGVALAREVRARYPDTPIVLHTGGDVRKAAAQVPDVPCFTKDVSSLRDIIREFARSRS